MKADAPSMKTDSLPPTKKTDPLHPTKKTDPLHPTTKTDPLAHPPSVVGVDLSSETTPKTELSAKKTSLKEDHESAIKTHQPLSESLKGGSELGAKTHHSAPKKPRSGAIIHQPPHKTPLKKEPESGTKISPPSTQIPVKDGELTSLTKVPVKEGPSSTSHSPPNPDTTRGEVSERAETHSKNSAVVSVNLLSSSEKSPKESAGSLQTAPLSTAKVDHQEGVVTDADQGHVKTVTQTPFSSTLQQRSQTIGGLPNPRRALVDNIYWNEDTHHMFAEYAKTTYAGGSLGTINALDPFELPNGNWFLFFHNDEATFDPTRTPTLKVGTDISSKESPSGGEYNIADPTLCPLLRPISVGGDGESLAASARRGKTNKFNTFAVYYVDPQHKDILLPRCLKTNLYDDVENKLEEEKEKTTRLNFETTPEITASKFPIVTLRTPKAGTATV